MVTGGETTEAENGMTEREVTATEWVTMYVYIYKSTALLGDFSIQPRNSKNIKWFCIENDLR